MAESAIVVRIVVRVKLGELLPNLQPLLNPLHLLLLFYIVVSYYCALSGRLVENLVDDIDIFLQ